MIDRKISKLQATIAEIRGLADLDRSRPLSLPPETYTSEAFLELERECIFRSDWICVGRADEIPQPGDFFTSRVDTTPVLVVRNDAGKLSAMANVCRHHMSEVVSGAGNRRSFTCPYHAWTYDLDGRLTSAPRMPADGSFDPSAQRLPEIRLELWAGFIFLNLDSDASALSPRLEGLQQLLANYHVENMRTVWRRQEVWQTNWKLLTENFMEAYHVPVVHPTTLIPFAPAENIEILPGGDGYNFYRHKQGGDYAAAKLDPGIAIENSDLTEHELAYAYIGGVFPSHVFSVAWDWLFWLSLQPDGADKVRVDWGVGGPVKLPLNQPDYPNFPYPRLVETINQEDRLRVESAQRGAASGFACQGRLHHHEEPICDLIRYLSRRVTSFVESRDAHAAG